MILETSVNPEWICPVCDGACLLHDVVDFNKSCEEARGKFFDPAGISVSYALCCQCGFCFAPQMKDWSTEEFAKYIYNQEYILVDPDYVDARPRANANLLNSLFGDRARLIRHLDYGGGSGLLAMLLQESGWGSASYDPFAMQQPGLGKLGTFDLITAFEVFEHVPDPKKLILDLGSLLAPEGMVLFSTLLSDQYIRPGEPLGWWYASPRNGHISLFSNQSLVILARRNRLNFASFSTGLHAFIARQP